MLSGITEASLRWTPGLVKSSSRPTLRFEKDAELDRILSPHNFRLQGRLSARSLQDFFSNNLTAVEYKEQNYGGSTEGEFYADTNPLGQPRIRGGSCDPQRHFTILISHPILRDHQVDALLILFKLAGATFEAYADSSVVDRCFELLKGHKFTSAYPSYDQRYHDYLQPRTALVQVRAPRVMKCGHWANESFQEVIALRESGWEGLPPPPIFKIGKSKPTGTNQNDPAATPVATSLGLPNREIESQISRSPPPEPVTIPQADIVPASPSPQSLTLRPSASPVSPTSQPQTFQMSSPPSIPQ